ncbi:MAG: hypothetical protein SGPRY_013734 [Prymnesium sp.]
MVSSLEKRKEHWSGEGRGGEGKKGGEGKDGGEGKEGGGELYARLGVSKGATEQEIKRAYRMLALKKHPDKGGDPEEFKAIAEAYAILSDPEKKRVYDATGEVDMADLDIDEFISSGMLSSFFKEMMEESGMAEEMLAMGEGSSIDDLQASFESFFKASMGMGDGPVLMPDGSTIDASSVPTMAEMASLEMGEEDMEPEELADLMRMAGKKGAIECCCCHDTRFGALPLPPFGRKKGPVGLDDLDDDEEEVEAMLAAMMGRQMGKGGKQKPARLPPTSIPIRPAPTGRGGGSAIDRSAPLDQQWVAAAKAGAVDALKRCYEADNSLLTKPARGIGHTALHWSAAAGLTLPASRSAYPALPAVTYLLDAGCPVDVRNAGESTPLHSAAGGGHLAVVEELLRRGE